MMNVLYTEEDLIPLKKRLKSSIIKASLSLGISILLCAITLFIAKEETAGLFKFIDSVIAIIGGWIALGYLFLSILKNRKKIKLVNTILVNPKNEYSGEIKDIHGPITLASGYTAFDIKIEKNREKHSFYYNIDTADYEFKVGDIVSFQVGAQNFIYAYDITESKQVGEENDENLNDEVNEDDTK